ncbi:MAG: thiopurine S-methyltransferase [Candidatus Cloacimonetes bacterium]|nr:thiopurine S-methyltransferase [Candidatus Cloacimonadota bacterium]
MEARFWEDKWENKVIGFNQSTVNPFLKEFGNYFKESTGDIFVPLCGKSIDMLYLQDQSKKNIIGSELVESAVIEFFNENSIDYQVQAKNSLKVYTSSNYQLIQGDIFQISKDQLQSVQWVYDRASIVALPKAMRKQYAEFLIQNVPQANIMFILFEYDDSKKLIGPPFSVTSDEIQELFSSHYSIELINSHQTEPKRPKFVEQNIKLISENTYILKPLT